MSIEEHLIAFAKDQLSVMKGWEGRAYIRRCLLRWEETYGKVTADRVRASLNEREK